MRIINESKYIHPSSNASIDEEVVLFSAVWIGPHCCIGGRPEIKDKWLSLSKGRVIISPYVTITGLVTIDGGAKGDTIIGEGCFIMKHCHVGHDAILGERVILSPGAKVGGECIIGADVNIGMNAVIHQQTEIPEKCMIGMGAVITKKAAKQMKPGETWAGNPAKKIGMNKKWLKK